MSFLLAAMFPFVVLAACWAIAMAAPLILFTLRWLLVLGIGMVLVCLVFPDAAPVQIALGGASIITVRIFYV